jgi:pimeloyl-ACP methyl ester carboxylesterase
MSKVPVIACWFRLSIVTSLTVHFTFAAAFVLSLSQAYADYADSANIRVDTRTLTMNTLVISGPASAPWGQDTAYSAILNYEGASPEDVTAQCTWSVKGGPSGINWWEAASMSGNVLKPGVVSTVPLQISATITRNNGKIASNTLSVTVTEGNGMNIGISRPVGGGPNYVSKSGANFTWSYAANASGLALLKPGVTVAWYLDGVKVGAAASLSTSFTGSPGTKELKVIATDTGRTGQSISHITFNVPPRANEPPLVTATDPGFGEVVDENGSEFQFNRLNTANGLIVLTHGLYGGKDDDGKVDKWLRDMASAIRSRLNGKPLPNIVIYGWGERSNPYQFFLLDRAKLDLLADAKEIRPVGLDQGRELAAWIRKEISRGNVSVSAPVHLVGHSAGGFVVGECAWQLGSSFQNMRVTMLDTPFPIGKHLADIPGSGRRLDRYVSSYFGAQDDPFAKFVTPNPGIYDYVLLGFLPTFPAHSDSYKWYNETVISGSAGAKGFGWSPFLSPIASAPMSSLGTFAVPMAVSDYYAPKALSLSRTETPITGFSNFGLMTAVTGGFQVTEGDQQNSGITLAGYTMPIGAQLISFRYQFTGAGDGDFLVASQGETTIGFGADNDLGESGEVTVNMPVEHLAGQSGDLVFRLMSRGSQNAVATIKGITITEVDDADLDGLTNAQEATAGTNALKADSDDDGLDDAMELNTTGTYPMRPDSDGDGAKDGSETVAGTDPLNAGSLLSVRESGKAGSDFTITWSSVAGRSYRILRSEDLTFETYRVVASGIAAAPPQQSHVDAGGATAPRMFYRVEVE